MSLDLALRLTEIALGLVVLQQAAEHLSLRRDQLLYGLRAALAVALVIGVDPLPVLLALFATTLWHLHRWQGPYNGGSDRMGVLILTCLTLAHLFPGHRDLALGYLAAQLILSYVISGWVKIVNPAWRRGEALRDVFRFSAYPVSEGLRGWANRPRLMFVAGWAVMLFELVFPVSLISAPTLWAALVIAAAFHLSNACFFGLNRFFWTWIAAYPSILWLQERLTQGA